MVNIYRLVSYTFYTIHSHSLTFYISFNDVSRSLRSTNTFYVKKTNTNYGKNTC